MNEEIIVKAQEILKNRASKEQGSCVLAQIDIDGFPTAATISPSKIDGIHSITFCTGIGSNWAKRIEKNNRASVCFNSETEQYNITLVGMIEVVADPETKRRCGIKAWATIFRGPKILDFVCCDFILNVIV